MIRLTNLLLDPTEICLMEKMLPDATNMRMGLASYSIRLVFKSGREHFLVYNDENIFDKAFENLSSVLS